MGGTRKSNRVKTPRLFQDFVGVHHEHLDLKQENGSDEATFTRSGLKRSGDKAESKKDASKISNHNTVASTEKYVDLGTGETADGKMSKGEMTSKKQKGKTHIAKDFDNRSTQCRVCQKTFSHRSSLTQHMLIHSDETPFKCNVCNKTFIQKYAREIHKRRAHSSEKAHKCSECDYAAKVPCDLQNHVMRMHSSDKAYKCETCELRFSTKTKRNNHIAQVHKRGPNFYCNECSYKTHTKNLLQMHVKTRHTESERYKCEICGSVLKTQYSREVHMRSHRGLKPYKCDKCGKEFVSSSRVAAHKRTHAEPECMCTICGKKFINKHKLQIHIDGVHGSMAIFPCPWCKYRTGVRHNLKKHCKNVHELYYPPRTRSRSIPIKEREDVLKNGPKTIVLPPPLYPDAIDIGLKGIKEKTNPLLLVKELPIYVPNVENHGSARKSAGTKKVYCVEIYKRKEQEEKMLSPIDAKTVSIAERKELILNEKSQTPLTSQAGNSNGQNKRYTCVRETKYLKEDSMKSGNSNYHKPVCTLQTLLNQPKDIVIQGGTFPKHVAHVVPKNSSSIVVVPTVSDKQPKDSHELKVKCTESDIPEIEGTLKVVENYQEANVAVANLETTATQPVSAQSVQVFHHGDHSYFVIGNNKDLDGAHIQEVVIDNSGLPVPLADQEL